MQCFKSRRYCTCSYVCLFSALKLWLICNYVLYRIQIMKSVFEVRKSNVNTTPKTGEKKCFCPIFTKNKYSPPLLPKLTLLFYFFCIFFLVFFCFVMQSVLEMGLKSHLFTCLICNHIHLTEYSNRKDSLLNY